MQKEETPAISWDAQQPQGRAPRKSGFFLVMTANPRKVEAEQDLFQAIQEGRPGWQRSIFDEYVSLVRGLLGKTLGPRDDIEDLVGDVFVGLFESARNIRSSEGLRSYVVSVALNTARREIKRMRRRRLLFWVDAPADEVERVAGTDDPKAKAALRQLSRFLDELDPEERLVYVLHVLEGLPIAEVSEALTLSSSTVKRRLKRASERMLRRVERNPLLKEYVLRKSEASDDE